MVITLVGSIENAIKIWVDKPDTKEADKVLVRSLFKILSDWSLSML